MNLTRKDKPGITSIGTLRPVRHMTTLLNISSLITGTTIESTMTIKQERYIMATTQKNMEKLTMMAMAITFTMASMATMSTLSMRRNSSSLNSESLLPWPSFLLSYFLVSAISVKRDANQMTMKIRRKLSLQKDLSTNLWSKAQSHLIPSNMP